MGNVTSSRRRQQQRPPVPDAAAAPASYVYASNVPYQVPYAPADPYPYQAGRGPAPHMYYAPYPPPPPPPPPTAMHQHHHHHHRPWPYAMRPPPPQLPPPAPAPPPPPPSQHQHQHQHHPWGNGAVPPPQPPPPYVEHHKTTTIRNDVNLKKETLHLERDEHNPDCFLVAFNFDSMVSGSISIFFFAKEGSNCSLTALKPSMCPPFKVPFEKGLGQKFCQPSGTGIDLSFFEESELTKVEQDEVFPIVIRAEACSNQLAEDSLNSEQIGNPLPKSVNSQITQAVFERKDNGEYRVKVIKQILWVDGVRYELQEIYGIGSSAGSDFDSNDPGKECVICMSEPRDTTVLPCRHMCMCSECAKLLRLQTNRCPICRRPVERLMEIKVNKSEELEGGFP